MRGVGYVVVKGDGDVDVDRGLAVARVRAAQRQWVAGRWLLRAKRRFLHLGDFIAGGDGWQVTRGASGVDVLLLLAVLGCWGSRRQ